MVQRSDHTCPKTVQLLHWLWSQAQRQRGIQCVVSETWHITPTSKQPVSSVLGQSPRTPRLYTNFTLLFHCPVVNLSLVLSCGLSLFLTHTQTRTNHHLLHFSATFLCYAKPNSDIPYNPALLYSFQNFKSLLFHLKKGQVSDLIIVQYTSVTQKELALEKIYQVLLSHVSESSPLPDKLNNSFHHILTKFIIFTLILTQALLLITSFTLSSPLQLYRAT